MRDLYLHIGLHKTGTTYLQRLVLENRDLFLDAGLGLGPYLHPAGGNHYPLIQALAAEGYRREAFERIAGEVAATPGAKVLLTAEEFCSAITPFPDRIAALHAALARHFNPKVVIFLRRQDFLKESVFVQAVKTWYTGGILKDDHYDLDHDARLRALEALFGLANVKVCLYRDGAANDLLGAFMTALELEIDRARLRPIPPQNVSMHRRQALFMSQVPKSLRAQEGREGMQFAREITAALLRSEAIADDGERFMMSPRARYALVAAHQAGNRALVARHGLADAGGFVDLPDPDAPWAPPAPIRPAERAAALGAVLRHHWSGRSPAYALRNSLRAALAFARMRSGSGAPERLPTPSRPAA